MIGGGVCRENTIKLTDYLCTSTKSRNENVKKQYQKGTYTKQYVIGNQKNLYLTIPQPIKKENDWKRHTRFVYSIDPEKSEITLKKSTEKTNNELVLCDTVKLSVSVCSDAGWQRGDIITARYKGKKIICTKNQ